MTCGEDVDRDRSDVPVVAVVGRDYASCEIVEGALLDADHVGESR